MTTLPTTLATIATSLITSLTSASQNADLNNDGVVDSTDLVLLATNIGACDGECQSDINNDGVTDSLDIMDLMKLWGPVPNYVAQDDSQDQSTDDAAQTRDPNRDMSWQGQDPVLFDAIYYDQYTEFFSHGGPWRWQTAKEYNQGEHTKAWTAANNIAVQPMVYGSVDWDHDNNLTEEDKANFAIWLDEYVPADYEGPICLDLEGQWWSIIDTANQNVMDIVIDTYLEHLEVAKSLRPNAKIGFWGFPKKTHTDPNYQTASVDRLLSACTAIFPDVYEWNAGGDDSSRLQLHVERAMEMVNGQKPVYVQTSTRYKTSPSSARYLHDQAEFIRDQVKSSMNAVWTDADGKEHRIQGIALWDAYTFVGQFTEGWSEMNMDERKAHWNDLDLLHVDFLTEMKTYVDAAGEEAQQRRASAESDESQAAAQELAAQEEARLAELARIATELEAATEETASATNAYNKSSKKYRSARKSWSKAKRSFAKSKRKYKKGSKQYKKALARYKKAQRKTRTASRSFKKQRKTYVAARANLNRAQAEWQEMNGSFVAETTMLASN